MGGGESVGEGEEDGAGVTRFTTEDLAEVFYDAHLRRVFQSPKGMTQGYCRLQSVTRQRHFVIAADDISDLALGRHQTRIELVCLKTH